MKRDAEIIGLMKGTVPYTKKTLSRLSDWIEKYPYFQAAHLLHTLNLLHLKDTHFLFDLRKTAIYVPDRRQFFFRVEKKFFTPERIEASEEAFAVESSLEIIDNFLSANNKDTTVREKIALELTPVSVDYISCFLSDDTENQEAPLLAHQEAVDKFLEKDAISPVKIQFRKSDKPDEPEDEELPEPLSESVNNDSFFTETLAKIYIKQKKYDKALEIIRKLNLIYPEKSCYFADQIRFLEKLIKNINKN